MNREFVRELLIEESFAYGFTIAFWGSGVLLVDAYGLLDVFGVLAYAGGAVTGFGLLAVATFDGAVDTVDLDSSPQYPVLAGIHYLSGLVPIGATHLIVVAPLGSGVSLFLAGAGVSVFYNAFAAAEETISEAVWRVESRYLDGDHENESID